MIPSPIKKRTILCVDDDADDLVLLREAVNETHQAFHLREAHDGREALDYLRNLRMNGDDLPCLIILDINMPELNGKEMLAIVKNDEALKNIPIVIFTTSARVEDQAFCSSFSTDMVSKPNYFEELKDTVQKLLNYCAPPAFN